MYEQYTDKQIVEMLKPKLAKLGWGKDVDNIYYYFPETCKMIATIYRSAYIRGQLGRSFIIGESKRTEHCVPATRDNVKVDRQVKMIDEESHRSNPWFFPDVGTVGIVTELSYNKCKIQWPKDITIKPSRWWCNYERLEVLLCE